jgi:hypothetical protein
MDVVALILSIVSLVVAIAGVILVFAVERARKPRVAIEPGQGHWPSPSPFAHVAVLNKRPKGWLGRHFGGVTVTNCRASIEFLKGGVSVLGPIDARWSGAPEPKDSSEYPLSYRWDLAATGQPEQIAIARTDGRVTHAFSAESYSYASWQKPEWLLDPGEYDVVVRLAATEAETSEMFRLIISSNGRLTLDACRGDAPI